MTRLPEGWAESVARIARMCASRTWAGGALTYAERADVAAGGILDHVAELGGWPEGVKELFRAGDNAIKREAREQAKHIRHLSFWTEPRGSADPIGEGVTDRVAVWQVTWALTDGQWAAVWAMAEAIRRGGGRREAAALLGANVNAFGLQLSLARKRARALWVAPGDTPARLWAADPKGSDRRSPGAELRRRTRERAVREAAA
jgi:hypothetical protein